MHKKVKTIVPYILIFAFSDRRWEERLEIISSMHLYIKNQITIRISSPQQSSF